MLLDFAFIKLHFWRLLPGAACNLLPFSSVLIFSQKTALSEIRPECRGAGGRTDVANCCAEGRGHRADSYSKLGELLWGRAGQGGGHRGKK